MAVYTPVSEEKLKEFLSHYDLGALKDFQGIEKGVSNTNYYLITTQNHYILTLFEPRRVEYADIPFFLNYVNHLQTKGIPCPSVFSDHQQATTRSLCQCLAAIFEYLQGNELEAFEITPAICEQVGVLNARMHLAVADFSLEKPNRFGPAQWLQWLEQLHERLNTIQPGLQELLAQEFADLQASWPKDLPKGAVHTDLFTDNIFFQNGEISGVIDFHFACTEYFAYDLAVTINAWCFSLDDRFCWERFNALLKGYQSIRPLKFQEQAFLPLLLRGVALRFTLSRAEEFLEHTPEQLMVPKAPHSFIQRLIFFQTQFSPNHKTEDHVTAGS